MSRPGHPEGEHRRPLHEVGPITSDRTPGTGLAGRALPALAMLVALVLVWRVVASGTGALLEENGATGRERLRSPLAVETPDTAWRARLAQNPADHAAMVMLGLEYERQGKADDARAAMAEALRLAPANRQTLLEAGAFHLRAGEEPQALAILRRVGDLYPDARGELWPVFVSALDARRHDDFFAGVVRDNPAWWPAFFGHACRKATDVDALQRVFNARALAGTVVADERRCLVDRLQRENRWANAYQVWLNSLPADQRRRVGFVFNGGFELPLSNLGFDWTVPPQDGVDVDAQPTGGATGRRALRVDFVNKRWAGPPVQQYLMLHPGRYRFEGRGRADGLETWLGVQWGLYCLPVGRPEPRQLARSGRFLASSDWEAWGDDFAVPGDCGVQVLRLELANPRRDAATPGNVAARLRGTAWFDDFRVRSLD